MADGRRCRRSRPAIASGRGGDHGGATGPRVGMLGNQARGSRGETPTRAGTRAARPGTPRRVGAFRASRRSARPPLSTSHHRHHVLGCTGRPTMRLSARASTISRADRSHAVPGRSGLCAAIRVNRRRASLRSRRGTRRARCRAQRGRALSNTAKVSQAWNNLVRGTSNGIGRATPKGTGRLSAGRERTGPAFPPHVLRCRLVASASALVIRREIHLNRRRQSPRTSR